MQELNTSHAPRDREADHRIGNSLAFLSSALRHESRRIDSVAGARIALVNAANRLGAVSRLHGMMGRDGTNGRVRLSRHLEDFSEDLCESLDIDMRVDGEDIAVPMDVAGCLAIVVNELATNAVKHGGAEGRTAITVTCFTNDDGHLVVIVGDNGKGLPAGFRLDDTRGLGMVIVTSTVQKHRGTIRIEKGPCAVYRIELPIR
ncbi:sensor histidine kinase [Profundibacterium mesophilum]|uniref:histidine kinase n=1 Tax=Profundibacterium mesophilum KAUST100406-0324 TaxID=1037889 RepID=A0A921TBL9_9RHOB|nr:sensor histidine kinase [Profundibacterium mesophilum]KAF0675870.1 two-component system OmpR family sensor histidine kinase KdpD [Profundibacterium mesophilum KAUST100406-0324]